MKCMAVAVPCAQKVHCASAQKVIGVSSPPPCHCIMEEIVSNTACNELVEDRIGLLGLFK